MSDIWNLLKQAFPIGPPSSEVTYLRGWEENYLVREIYQGQPWESLNAEDLARDPLAFHYLAPDWDKYYLPIYVYRAVVEDSVHAEILLSTAVYLFRVDHEPDDIWAGSSRLSKEQRCAMWRLYQIFLSKYADADDDEWDGTAKDTKRFWERVEAECLRTIPS